MRRLLIALSMTAWLGAGIPAGADAERTSVFRVEGMTYALCAKAIEKALRGVAGVRSVAVDPEAERVTVVADSALSPERIEQAIESAGSYTAERVASQEPPGAGTEREGRRRARRGPMTGLAALFAHPPALEERRSFVRLTGCSTLQNRARPTASEIRQTKFADRCRHALGPPYVSRAWHRARGNSRQTLSGVPYASGRGILDMLAIDPREPVVVTTAATGGRRILEILGDLR